MTRLLASLVCAVIVLISPGLEPYAAFAATVGHGIKEAKNPALGVGITGPIIGNIESVAPIGELLTPGHLESIPLKNNPINNPVNDSVRLKLPMSLPLQSSANERALDSARFETKREVRTSALGQGRDVFRRVIKIFQKSSSDELKAQSNWEKSANSTSPALPVSETVTKRFTNTIENKMALNRPSVGARSRYLGGRKNVERTISAPSLMARKNSKLLVYALSALSAAAWFAFDPLSSSLSWAALVAGGVSVRCMQERAWAQAQAMKRAIEEENRRRQAFLDLRNRIWHQALHLHERSVQSNTRVLVDVELVTEGSLEALVRTYDELWKRWIHEPPADAQEARDVWKAQFEKNLKDNLSYQGLTAEPGILDELIRAELPGFIQLAEDWSQTHSAVENIYRKAQEAFHEAQIRVEASASDETALASESTINFKEETQSEQAGQKREASGAVRATQETKDKTSGMAANEKGFIGIGTLSVLALALGVAALMVLMGPPHWLALSGFASMGIALGAVRGGHGPANHAETPGKNETRVAQMPMDQFLKGNPHSAFAKNILTDLTSQRPKPFAGRALQVAEILRKLSQQNSEKKGIVLIGPTGIGKGALLGHIASQVGHGTYPMDIKFLELDLAKLLSLSSQMSTQANRESPVDQFFEGVLPSLRGKAVLVIKGVDQLFGPSGSNNFLDRLRQPIESGGLRYVLAMTPAEAALIKPEHFLRKYSAEITLREPDDAQALQMMLAHKQAWEASHGISILDPAIEKLVQISKDFLMRINPLELIHDLEEALERHSPASQVLEAQVRLEDGFSQLAIAIEKYRRTGSPQDYNAVVTLARQLQELEKRSQAVGEVQPLGIQDVRRVMAEVHNNSTILSDEDFSRRLLDAIPKVRSGIVGQDEAVRAVTGVIKRTAAGLTGRMRPLGSFIFLGPTGVGKTEMGKVLNRALFDSEDIIRVDMSEYMEPHSVSKLIGAPPGYVGHEAGGILTEAVYKRPYSVVLFDEIEKSHADVMNVLLQILDDGRLTDSKGRTVDFRRTVVIMTSNIASAEIQELVGRNASEEVIQRALANGLQGHFRPEFLNRVDRTIVFKPLTEGQVFDIGKLLVQKELVSPLALQGHHLADLSETALRYVVENGGFDPKYGARPLRRQIQDRIGEPLAEHLLQSPGEPRKIAVGYGEGRIRISSESKRAQEISKTELPKGRLGRWVEHVLDRQRQPEVSPKALRSSYDSYLHQPLASRSWGAFSLQTPAPSGELLHELTADHWELNGFDPGLASENTPGGGIFGWMQSLKQAGYSNEDVLAVQTWLAKQVRCGKDCAAAKNPESNLRVRWEKFGGGDAVFKIVAPALEESEMEEAYEAFENHYSKQTENIEESLLSKDELAGQGKRGRALLFEMQRSLSKIPGARFGAHWDLSSSTYWLFLPKKADVRSQGVREDSAAVGQKETGSNAPQDESVAVRPETSSDVQAVLTRALAAAPRSVSQVQPPHRTYTKREIRRLAKHLKKTVDEQNIPELMALLKGMDWPQVKVEWQRRWLDVLINRIVNAETFSRIGENLEILLPLLEPWAQSRKADMRTGWERPWYYEFRQYWPYLYHDKSSGFFDWIRHFDPHNSRYNVNRHFNLRMVLMSLLVRPEDVIYVFRGDSKVWSRFLALFDGSDLEAAQIAVKVVNNFSDALQYGWSVERDRLISEEYLPSIAQAVRELPVPRQIAVLAELKAPVLEEVRRDILGSILKSLPPHVDVPAWDHFLEMLKHPGLFDGEDNPLRAQAAELLAAAPQTVLSKIDKDVSYAASLQRIARNQGLSSSEPPQSPELAKALEDVLNPDDLIRAMHQYTELTRPERFSETALRATSADIASLRSYLESRKYSDASLVRRLYYRATLSAQFRVVFDLYRRLLRARPDLMSEADAGLLTQWVLGEDRIVTLLNNGSERDIFETEGVSDLRLIWGTYRILRRLATEAIAELMPQRQDLAGSMAASVVESRVFRPWHKGYFEFFSSRFTSDNWIFVRAVSLILGASMGVVIFAVLRPADIPHMLQPFIFPWLIVLAMLGFAPLYTLRRWLDYRANRKQLYRFFEQLDPQYITTHVLSKTTDVGVGGHSIKPKPGYRRLFNILQRRAPDVHSPPQSPTRS